jgi:hypothetical protein
MALFDWLSPAKRKSAKPETQPVSSGLSRMEPTRPVTPGKRGAPVHHEPAPGTPANRKHERMARRELLYGVVRECMANAGVVSASYKFKVLSLDARGRQFLVMVDLSREYSGDTTRLAEIEAMVAQAAKVRHDIMVTAVYWRANDHVAVGLAGGRPQPLGASSRPAPLNSAPAPLVSSPAPLVSQPVPLAAQVPQSKPRPQPVVSQPAPLQAARGGQRYEPLDADEVAAFKKALAAGVSGAEALAAAQAHAPASSAKSFDGNVKHGPQSYTLLTGFEDTELPDTERAPALSATQYGDLR